MAKALSKASCVQAELTKEAICRTHEIDLKAKIDRKLKSRTPARKVTTQLDILMNAGALKGRDTKGHAEIRLEAGEKILTDQAIVESYGIKAQAFSDSSGGHEVDELVLIKRREAARKRVQQAFLKVPRNCRPELKLVLIDGLPPFEDGASKRTVGITYDRVRSGLDAIAEEYGLI